MVEVFNCRVTLQRHNQEAAEFAERYGIPGIAPATATRASRWRWPSTRCRLRDRRGAAQAGLAENEWHASRSTRLHPPRPRDGRCGRTSFDALARQAAPPPARSSARRRPSRSRRARAEADRRQPSCRPRTRPQMTRIASARPPTTRPLRVRAAIPRRATRGVDPRARGEPARRCSTCGPSGRSSSACSCSSSSSAASVRIRLGRGARLIGQANPGFLLLGAPRLLRHLPAPRPPLAIRPGAQRHADRLPRRDRDPVPVVVRELPRAGQARRPVPRIPAARQLRRLDLAHGRNDLHRAHRRHHRHRRAGPVGRLLVVPRPVTARRSTRSSSSDSRSPSGSSSWSSLLRPSGRHLPRFLPARIGELWERFHEGSTGALTVRSMPVIVGHDGRHLAARGAAAVLRDPGPGAARRGARHQRVGLRRACRLRC